MVKLAFANWSTQNSWDCIEGFRAMVHVAIQTNPMLVLS
jgi:hypothetical protein